MTTAQLDAVIIGAGPAGISCALELVEHKFSCVLLEAKGEAGGQLDDIDNPVRTYPGGVFENGRELKNLLLEHVRKIGLHIEVNRSVKPFDLEERTFSLGWRRVNAKAVVIATGARVRRLIVPGIERLAKETIYSLEHNPITSQPKSVIIVGGGDNALMDALILSKSVPQIYVVNRSLVFRARPDVVREVRENPSIKLLANASPIEFLGEKRLEAVKIKQEDTGEISTIDAEYAVIKIGYIPNTELFVGQLEMDESRHILVNANMETSVPGVYAAGDVVAGVYPTIATAVGHGALVAGAIRRSLRA